MDLVLIGSDSPLGLAVQRRLEDAGRHGVRPITLAASRFGSERQAKKAVRRGSPGAVVDLRLSALFGNGEDITAPDIDRCHWLAKACARSSMLYLLLSRDRVFSGQHRRPLRESEAPDAQDETGLALREAESRVLDVGEAGSVLRTGPLFSAHGGNLLVMTLEALLASRQASFDDSDQFCPSAVDDIARVIAAMLDQVSAGAEARGIFHYSAAERTTRYGFAEALLASAGQYADLGDISLVTEGDAADGGSRTLECNRLRDTFAIKQLPWRGQISAAVRDYFDRQEESGDGR